MYVATFKRLTHTCKHANIYGHVSVCTPTEHLHITVHRARIKSLMVAKGFASIQVKLSLQCTLSCSLIPSHEIKAYTYYMQGHHALSYTCTLAMSPLPCSSEAFILGLNN